MKKIGFIGLGIMGSRMASVLQKDGYQLIVHNRTSSKADDLINNGASWASSVAEVGAKSDIIVTVLSTPEVVKATALGEHGFIKQMKPDSIWINSSTVNPSFTKEMGYASKNNNIRYIDAPVAGTKGPAEKGELLFLAGGDAKDVKEVQPLLDSMGRKTLHLGEAGKGAAMKMLINQLLGQQMAAFSEALIMGEAMGIDKTTLFDILLATPVVAPVIKTLRPKIENENFDTNFPLKWIQKDLHLSSVSAYENGVPTPNLNATKEIYAQAKRNGFGNDDFTAVYAYLNTKKD